MKKGLTLIEVMLAVLILSIGMTVLLTAASRCVAVMKQAAYYQDARWAFGLAEAEYPLLVTEKIEDLEVNSARLPNGYFFSREVEEEPREEEDGLYIVRDILTGPGRGERIAEEIVRYVYRKQAEEPGASPPVTRPSYGAWTSPSR